MPKITLSRLKTLSRKTQVLITIALLLGLGVGTLLAVQGGAQTPHSVSVAKQTAKTQKTGGPVLGANTNTASTETSVVTAPKSAAASSPTQQQTPANQPAAVDAAPNNPSAPPAPTPAPDPCDKVVTGSVVTYADTGISFVESVTIPVGCSTGPFTVKTTDNRTVTFYDFSNKPTSPVRASMVSGGISTGSSSTYTVSATDAATPGYYEDFAYVVDSSSPYGGFAVTIKITVVPR